MRKNYFAVLLTIIIFIGQVSALAQDEPPPEGDSFAPDFDYQQEGQFSDEFQEPDEPAESSFSAPLDPQDVSIKENKVSLDFKGMDIIDVLRTLSERARINMVVGKNVTGRVTLFLKEVGIWDAFEIILLANDLAYEKKGEIINVMTQRDYELLYGERYQDKKQAKIVQLKYAKAGDLAKALNQIKTNVGRIIVDEGSSTIVLIDTPQKAAEMQEFIKKTDLPLETKIFELNYAQAEKLSAKLQEAVTKGVGSLKIDERTNKIVITDYSAKLEELSKVIKAFDEKTPQVLIDAQIIEIRPSDEYKIGVDWDFWIQKNLRLAASMPSAGTVNTIKVGLAPNSQSPSSNEEYKGIFDLLRTIGDTKILSSPRIIALNNQEAKILVGTKDAYITSTTSQSGTGSTVTSQSVNFVDVGIKLFVTPTINRDNFVTMKIKPEVSSAERTSLTAEGQVTQVPIVTTSEAETTVMIKDGVTVIIGGLRKEEKVRSSSRIPLLGDIPVLGWFFGNTSHEINMTEIVILLTPHIISGETSFADFSEVLPKDGTVVKMVRGEIVKERIAKSSVVTGATQDPSEEYFRFVVDKVQEVAMLDRPKVEKGEAQVEFTLTRRGKLVGEPQVSSITNPVLQPYVIRAIKNASPFPPFPSSIERQKQLFKMILYYE